MKKLDMTRRMSVTCGVVAVGGMIFGGRRVSAKQGVEDALAYDATNNLAGEKIAPYEARFGRAKPLVAVVALNEGTVISDFCIPFGVLARSEVADVITVSVRPGPVKMRPLTFKLNSTIDDFDRLYPQGADYIFVPAVENFNDATLVHWVQAQGRKGSTVISICYGALVVANTGLFDDRRATSHYSNEEMRAKLFPKVKWQKNIRYVADGKVVSSAGVTASMPTSIALVEAIAGSIKATQVASDVGITDWTSKHNSDAFKADPGNALMPERNARPQKTVGIPVKNGDDEIALALTAEAYTTNGVTTALAVAASKTPVRLAHGLILIPDKVAGAPKAVDRTLMPLSANQVTRALDVALNDISKTYGRQAARNVTLFMEYPHSVD